MFSQNEGGFNIFTYGKFHFITGEFLAGIGIDIFMKGIQFCVDIKEIEGEDVRPGSFYEMQLLGMKPGWAVYSLGCGSDILGEVEEDDDREVNVPKPLAHIFDEMRKTFLGRYLVVECEDSFELKGLKPAEWSRFKREMWSIIVEQYKERVYQEESDSVECEGEGPEESDSDVTMVEEDGFEVMSPCMVYEWEKLKGKLPEEKGFETVDMRSFRIVE
jgi:hypothetical protein